MINLKKYAENHGMKVISMSVLTQLKREIEEDIVFVTRTKTHKLNALQKRNLFYYINVLFN